MTGFQTKQIDTAPSVGETLCQKRVTLGLALLEVSRKLGISEQYLAALETGAYGELPGSIYARNFLRKYAELLGLSPRRLIEQYSSEQKIYQTVKEQDAHRDVSKPVAKIAKAHLWVTPQIIRSGVIGLVLLICLGYLGYKVTAIFAPPHLAIESPAGDVTTQERSITITGVAEPETIVRINGEQALIDQAGKFAELISLQQGMNTIEISAQKKHSRPAVIQRRIIVTEAELTIN